MNKYFGTDGIRGISNEELTPELALYVGKYSAYVLGIKQRLNSKNPLLLIGKDTRLSGDMIEHAITAGALSVGVDVISVGVVPTPAIPHLIKHYNANLGVMISASHNPYQFNGIKLFNEDGLKLRDEVEAEIEEFLHTKAELPDFENHKSIGRVIRELESRRIYEGKLENTLDLNLKGIRIGLDCANGSNYKIGPEVIKAFGAEIFTIGTEPNGININEDCGSTSLNALKQLVLKNKLDIGLAFDGDADRLLAVDENGEDIDGDRIMLALAKRMKKNGTLKDNTVVATVMSNMGMYIAMEEAGIFVEKTKVGDRYVLEKMLEKDYSIGGEQSGHIILKEFNKTGDGLFTALKLLEVLVKDVEKASDITNAMKSYPQVLKNIKVPNRIKYTIAEFEDIKNAIISVENKLGNRGRVLLRASGTEPLVRVMLEGENLSEINSYCDELIELIKDTVQNSKFA